MQYTKKKASHQPFRLIFSSIVGFFLVFVSSFNNHVSQAQTLTSSEETVVTATVPDNTGPTTPILIAPNNNSYVTTATPQFIWRGSTDDNGMDHYELSLDGGAPLFNDIPLTSTTNSSFTLIYDSVANEYKLTPAAGLTSGTHTWKIRAVDVTDNGTDSATWSFTIDTQAPAFVVTAIGEVSVSISAQDITTVPTSPLELENNEPLLTATGEAGSTVITTLSIPGEPTQTFTTTINSGGSWSLQLGLLPRDVIMTLDFVITDVAGNTSALSGVQFIINTPTVIFPPISTPTPTPTAAPEPTPITGEVTPTPEPTPSPTPLPPGVIEVPILPPREIARSIRQNLSDLVPEPLLVIISSLPEPVQEIIQETVETVAPVSAVVVTSAIPIASTVAVASQFGGGISPDLIIKILQALGLLPVGKPQGLVFDSESHDPVPFALITITNIPEEGQAPITETVVTDVDGIYKGIRLPPGKYRLYVSHQDYTFPAAKSRPPYLTMADYYRGEVFTVTSNRVEQLFLIPVDVKKGADKKPVRSNFRVLMSRLSRLFAALVVPFFFISALMTLLYPSIWNILLTGIYGLLTIRKTVLWFRTPIISGTVIDQAGNSLANAVVRLTLPGANELFAVTTSKKDGSFKFFGPKTKYQLSVVKEGYLWANAGTLSFYEVDVTTSPQQVVVEMKDATSVYTELFG